VLSKYAPKSANLWSKMFGKGHPPMAVGI